jgi:sn1-specific diacylglycerol lipase
MELRDLHTRCCKAGIPASAIDTGCAAHFVPFAMASYGALYYVYVNPKPSRFAELCCYCCCPERHRCFPFGNRDVPRPLSSALLSKAFICDVADIHDKDLLYVNNTNKFNEQAPYFVALDHQTKSIVISIRGTLR